MMMDREVIRRFYNDYYLSLDFKIWRDELTREIYTCLNSNIIFDEVKTVTDLCDVMSNKQYKGLRLESKKTHSRSTSGVEFDYIGKKAITELADMAIVSVITLDRRIVLLKTAFIQNKKVTYHKKSTSWKIDQRQLFLLKNFPRFNGVSGIFKGQTITFLNQSNTLGNYGLFSSNGDIIFLTARNTFGNQNASGSITFDSIRNAAISATLQNHYDVCHSRRKCCPDCFEHKYYSTPFSQSNSMPFFNNYNYALDAHEVVKELVYFNVGESSSAFGKIINENLHRFTGELLRSAFGYSIDDNHFNRNGGYKDNVVDYSGVSVILNHLELDKNNNS